MLSLSGIENSISKAGILAMVTDKVTRYVLLSLGAVTWLFALFLFYQLFMKVSVNADTLNQVLGVLQAVAVGGLGWYLRHVVGGSKNTPAPPTATP